ncbi:Sugar tr domain containing protein [Pyrenophora teres f. maculata]|nr:Sugar tr domain containing protein [Pyrenophora teres f. maculata]
MVLLIGCIWVSESPRWLIAQKRAPEGWAILRKLHADPNDPDEVAAHEEFYQMKKQIELELKNATGYLSIFRTPAYRKRVYMSCFIQYVANATGALVINNYSIIMSSGQPVLAVDY